MVKLVSELALRLGLSRTRLNRRLRTEHGTTATELLRNEQLDVAKRLLLETTLSVTVVAKKAAFGTRRSFQRVFFRATGMTPHAYRLRSPKCLRREP